MSSPWTTPPTFVVGQTVLAADLNTYIRDNTNFLYSPPCAKSSKTADIGITDSTWTSTALGNVIYDTDGITNTSNGTFTIQTAGVYILTATCLFATSSTNRREIRLNVNNGTLIAKQELGTPSSSHASGLSVTAHQLMAQGDTVVAEVWQNSGSTLNLLGSNVPLGYSLSAHWVGAGT